MDTNSNSEIRQGLLIEDSSDIPDISIDSSPSFDNSPSRIAHHRSRYRWKTAHAGIQIQNLDRPFNDGADFQDAMDESSVPSSSGIPIGSAGKGATSTHTGSVSSKQNLSTPNSNDALLSHISSRSASREFAFQDRDPAHLRGSPSLDPSGYELKPWSTHQSFATNQNAEENIGQPRNVFNSNVWCPSKRNIYEGRGNWLSVTIMILAMYSTIFSSIWLIIAIFKPRYGRNIKSTGSLTPSTASLLCAFFAKTIELSFVTVFVAFIGQILSRRALMKNSRGITIAEMSVRSWIMQPGSMITHWDSVRYAGWTFLGSTALTATIIAMLYTTASDALVSPKLKFGEPQENLLYGRVSTKFANPDFVESRCQTPIPKDSDPDAGSTCLGIEHAGQGYHNYQQYLMTWTDQIAAQNGSTELSHRPPAVGLLYDNTTVQGSWIDVQNMTELSSKYGQRIINNITMTMPHSGVFAAARDAINNIMQPETLDGLGEYYLTASVPSPAVNVLCASMSKDDLKPMVYTEWPNAKFPFNASEYPPEPPLNIPYYSADEWLNTTNVDDLFGFGKKYGRRHPIFPKFPQRYNTVLNTTGWYADSIYLLGTSPTNDSVLCSLRATQYPKCSTEYHASLSGGSLTSNCDDSNPRPYSKYRPNAPVSFIETDWRNIASEWAMTFSLNSGITDGNSANARLLTELIPTTPALDPSLPSIAEALAVLAGCTLLLSAQDAPFIHYWNYSSTLPTLAEPQYQAFPATLRTQNYASGGVLPWQSVFYLVLALVVITNVICLVHFIIWGGLVTDFVEPQNLFSLSVNSPPSRLLAGSCGGGPEKDQFKAPWFISVDGDHVFIKNGRAPSASCWRKNTSQAPLLPFDVEASPLASTYARLSNSRTNLL